MPRHHVHTAWAWFKSEIARQIGDDACTALFDEYARRQQLDRVANRRRDAPTQIARLEKAITNPTTTDVDRRRYQKMLDRRRALLDDNGTP